MSKNICEKCNKAVNEIYNVKKTKFFGKDGNNAFNVIPLQLFDLNLCFDCVIEFFETKRK